MGRIVIAVFRDEVVEHGAQGAIVLQQIRHYLDYRRSGWFTGTSQELATLTGLSDDQVRRTVKRLVDVGALEKTKLRAKHGDQTCSYRPAGEDYSVAPKRRPTLDLASGDSAGSGDGDSAGSRPGDSAGSIPSPELESGEPPLTPPSEGQSQPELFAPGAGGAVTARERKRRAGGEATGLLEGSYRAWLDRWPKGNRGSIPAGSRAFRKAVTAGATMEELDRQARNYQAARVAYHEAWAGVGDYWPTLMHCSTFLNSKRAMWDHEWGPDDLRYWPAPAGWSWDDRPVTSHDAGDEVPAEVRAQGGVAVAMWQADQRRLAETGAVAGG